MEASWIIIRIYFLRRRIYLNRTRVFIHIFNSILRIAFLITLYWFSMGGDASIINNVHFYFITGYVTAWIFDMLFTVCLALESILSLFKSLCQTNKVSNVKKNSLHNQIFELEKPKHMSLQLKKCKQRRIRFV